jgi:hypothetical protein
MGMLEDIPKIARQWPWTRGSGGRWQHLRRWVLLARLRRAGEEFPHLSNWGFPSWRQLGTVPDGMCVVGPRLARESHLLPAVPAGFPSARPAGCGGGPIRKFPALRRVWPGRRRRAARLSPVMRATGLTGRLRSCAGCYPIPSPPRLCSSSGGGSTRLKAWSSPPLARLPLDAFCAVACDLLP